MIRVYIDCNILIDWLLAREPFSYYAAKIIELTEENRIESYVSALTLANTHYIISKELNKKTANEFLNDSMKLFRFVAMSDTAIRQAIENRFIDFEDDLHYFAAVEHQLDYLLSRNKKDFRKEYIKTVDAEEFLTLEAGNIAE